MIYLYLFGTCFHFIYVFMIIVNKKVHKITVNADGTYSYPVFQNRVFDKAKHYLFPIPQSEIDKNRNLVQNPGWN